MPAPRLNVVFGLMVELTTPTAWARMTEEERGFVSRINMKLEGDDTLFITSADVERLEQIAERVTNG